MDYKKCVEQVLADPRYRENVEFGTPRSGHPEGKIKNHIANLEANLGKLKHRVSEDEYWKLKFLIHVHDTFKVRQIVEGIPSSDPQSHESLARKFASEFTDEADLLNILQNHDENFALWRQFQKTGAYDQEHFAELLKLIQDWDLFLIFTIIDGTTPGKDLIKLPWFINEVRKHKSTRVDAAWAELD